MMIIMKMMMTTTTTTTTTTTIIIIMMMMMMMMMIIIIIIIMLMMMMMMMMMIMMMVMMMMMMMMMITFKGAIRDFLQSPHCAANRLQHVRSSGPDAIMCKSHASHRALITCNNMSCYLPRGRKRQLSYYV